MKGEKGILGHRLRGSYVSGVISISLVLVLIGTAVLLLVNSRRVSEYFKENLQITVLMKQGVGEEQAIDYVKDIERLPYVRAARIVTVEEGTEELKAMLGEDFLSVFETSPVPVSVEINLVAEYVSADSIDAVIPCLAESALVDEVDCQKSLVEALNTNLVRISMFLGILVLLLLFISLALIGNTVRLGVFSRRFTIHTMKLVGATRSFIRRPFLASAAVEGLLAAVLAISVLSGGVLLVRRFMSQLFEIFAWDTLAIAAGVVILCGPTLCVVSTYFLVNKLVSLDKEDLYC